MKKSYLALLLALFILLSGCGSDPSPSGTPAPADTPNTGNAADASGSVQAAETVPATVPADGDPGDVTCKGSYTAEADADTVVATAGSAKLTNDELQVWYWAEVAQYRSEAHETAPDFTRPLDTQACGIDSSVNSWQQYFLREALDAWHSAQALVLQSRDVPQTWEEAYQPNLENHETYMTGMPATEFLYGYDEYYEPNTMHQAYLDALPDTLDQLARDKGYDDAAAMASAAFGASEDALHAAVQANNLGYMYFTELSYDIEPSEEELAAYCEENQAGFDAAGTQVDIRHILLVPENVLKEEENPHLWKPPSEITEPIVLEYVEVAADGTVTCSELAWENCEQKADTLLEEWNSDKLRKSEFTFAELAVKNSQDTGTALDGGAYYGIQKGQLIAALDEWCFDPARQVGDTGIVRSPYGVHILYLAASRENAYALAQEDYYRQQQAALIAAALERYPMEVRYSDIALTEAEGTVAAGELLYPDVAHERFPEIPLYLQQDYPTTKYGAFKITTNGCGITSMAMLASYMADDELTPPEMCARYGDYSHSNGTDGMIFNYEPAVMGFYLREKTYDHRVARAALEEGQVVISVQHNGYWTRGGHYIVCESITEDGLVQVRDSNIYNYSKLKAHLEDLHKWSSITADGSGYWIFEDKITHIPACTRCGTGEAITESLLKADYLCEKCAPALLRRNTYLTGCEE